MPKSCRLENWPVKSLNGSLKHVFLAKLCTYTPDFAIWLADGSMEFVDCKGSGPMDDKSRVKMKCAAEKFPQFLFAIEQRQTKKNGGGWKREEF